MALLRRRSGGTPVILGARHLVGRSSAADTRLDDRNVSGEHAVFNWSGTGWQVRDLGSSNGTWVGERRVEPGQRVAVSAGDVVAFGSPGDPWILESAHPPSIVATSPDRVVEGEGDLLALPSHDDPVVVVELDPERGWVLSEEEVERVVRDRERIVAGDDVYELILPTGVAPTIPRVAGELKSARRLSDVSLEVAVSGDEEYLEVTVHLGGERHPLPPKAHQYLLLVLARARLEDTAEGVSASEAGWLYSSDLRKMLRVSANQFYVVCHRCRRELEALEVVDAAQLIQKRSTSRQLRLGVGDVTVRAL